MKKRLLSIITALIMTLGLFASYPAGALTTRDPFQELAFGTYDGYKAEPAPEVWLEHGIYEQSKDYWIVFNNVNFTSSPKSVTLSAYSANTKVTQTGYIELRLDSPDGRLIASIKPNPSTAWGATANTVVDITEEVTGIHDLYAVYRETHYQYRIGGIKFNAVGDNLLRVNGRTSSKPYVDSKDEEEYRMANKLVHLGLMEAAGENTFGYETPLTVEDALKAASRMQGLDFESQVKKDATSETQYFRQFGYNKADDFGKYVATDPITAEDFCGLILGVLGWNEVIKAKGTTVMKQAQSLKLFSGMTAPSASAFVTRGQAAQILENALDSKYLMVSAVTDKGGYEYDVIKDESIIRQFDDVYKTEGVVDHSYITALSSGKSGVDMTDVVIDGNVYNMGNTDIMYCVGKRVDFWFKYDKDTNERTILYYEEPEGQSTHVTSEQLIKIGMSEAQYEDNKGKIKTVKFKSAVPVIYNGSFAKGYTTVSGLIGNLSKFKGSITFVSNDGDKNADIIIIESYKSVIFKSFNENEGFILDADGRRYDLKNGSKQYMYTSFKEDGSATDMDVVSKGTVLDIATTYGTSGTAYNTIIVCDGSVYGEVTHIQSDYVTIDGFEYRLSPELIDDSLIANNAKVEAGAVGTFRTDSFGYIRSFESGEKLMAAIIVDYDTVSDAFESEFLIKLYTSEGKLITSNGAKNIYVDGNKFDSPSALKDYLDKNAVKGSVAIYRLNGKKELNMLDTIAVGDGGVRDRIVRIGVNSRNLLYGNILFGNMKSAAAWVGSLVFTAPYSGGGYTVDEASYGVTNALDGGWARYDFYSTDGKIGFANVAVLYPESIGNGSSLFLVERLTTTLTPDGDVTAGADGWFVGGKALRGSITFDAITGYSSYFSDEIKPGDVIKLGYDAKGLVVNAGTSATVPTGITKSEIFATDKLSNIIGTINGTQSSDTVYWYGEIVDISDIYMVMESEAGATMVCNIKNAKAICYNSDTNKAREVDFNDIALREGDTVGTGTKVLVRLNQFKAGTILFYE